MNPDDWQLALEWYLEAKRLLSFATTIERDTLHVLIGVALQFAIVALGRWEFRDWAPLGIVALLALGNEAADLLMEQWPDPVYQYGESLKDLLLTLVVPLAITLAARWRPRWFAPRPAERDAAEPRSVRQQPE